MDSFSDEVPVSSFYNPPNITDEVDLLLPDVPHDMDKAHKASVFLPDLGSEFWYSQLLFDPIRCACSS